MSEPLLVVTGPECSGFLISLQKASSGALNCSGIQAKDFSANTTKRFENVWESIWHKHCFTSNMVGFAAVNMKVALQETQGLFGTEQIE